MNGQAFVGTQPQSLNLAEGAARELDQTLTNVFLMPLYYARYRNIDVAAGGQAVRSRSPAAG